MKTHYLMLVFALLIGFTACDDDKNSVPQVTVPISLSAPDSVQNAVISNVTATLKTSLPARNRPSLPPLIT